MKVPLVAIVGRPNVGKSSVFNWIAGRRLAIVDDVPGVTRDRVSQSIDDFDRPFELVDTGGIGIEDSDDLTEEVEHQIRIGISEADVILFVVDVRTGLVPLDTEVARRLRRVDVPIVCVANKADGESLDAQAEEFHRLGHGEPICVSTKAKRNRAELIELLLARLPEADRDEREAEEPVMRVAMVGRRNVGKSTLVNALARTERMIVSEVPGTTRDSVDVRFELDGKSFIAIDTPGLRKSKSRRTDLDFYSNHRAQRSVRRADVVLLFFDASQRIGKVDKQLCSYIDENFKPCIFVVNKWDLLHDEMPTERWADYLRETFGTMWHVPIAFVTGLTGKNVKKLLNHAQMLFGQSRERISTGQLNRLIKGAMTRHQPPLYHNRRAKIYYATQTATQPPTIVIKCNDPAAFPKQYRRYLLGVLRDQLSFGEVPIRVHLDKREREDRRADVESGK